MTPTHGRYDDLKTREHVAFIGHCGRQRHKKVMCTNTTYKLTAYVSAVHCSIYGV